MDGQQRKRFRREILRRRSAEERRAADTQAAQARAEMARAFRKQQRRKMLAGGLVAAGVLVGVSHWLQHLGAFQLPVGVGLLVGAPVRAVPAHAAHHHDHHECARNDEQQRHERCERDAPEQQPHPEGSRHQQRRLHRSEVVAHCQLLVEIGPARSVADHAATPGAPADVYYGPS